MINNGDNRKEKRIISEPTPVDLLNTAGNTAIYSKQGLGDIGKIAASAVLGGTVAEIGGGKFANGAITAAYSMMFNDMMHQWPNDRRSKHDLVFQGKGMKNQIKAMKYMIKRSLISKDNIHEVAAAVLENGDVVVFRDGSCSYESSQYYVQSENGNYYYKGIKISMIMHIHPMYEPYVDTSNPLRISGQDRLRAKEMGSHEIHILLLSGDLYSVERDNLSHYSHLFNVYKR